MSSTAWKAQERDLAKRLGGRRNGNRGTVAADVAHPLFAVECKERKQVPQYLKDWMSQALASGLPGQVPLVSLHELGQRHDGDLVFMRLKDFTDLHGKVKEEEDASDH